MKYLNIEKFDNTNIVKTCCVYKDQARWRMYSFNAQDNMEDLKYYRELAEDFGITIDDMIRLPQTHSDNILIGDRSVAGTGVTKMEVPEGTDGVITNEKNLMLLTIESDCTPVFILDPIKRAIGMVHSGWRGTVSKISINAIEKMIEHYGSNKNDLMIHFGPSICGKCYEVEIDLITEFKKILTDDEISKVFNRDIKREGKYFLDVTEAIRFSLLRYGIYDKQMTRSEYCTYHSGLFNSWRRDKDKTKQMLTGIMLI